MKVINTAIKNGIYMSKLYKILVTLTVLILCTPLFSYGEVYKWIDENGSMHFSNIQLPETTKNITIINDQKESFPEKEKTKIKKKSFDQNNRVLPLVTDTTITFSIQFSRLFLRTQNSKPVKWLTVKVINESKITLGNPVVRVIDLTNNIDLYGGKTGFGISGFHNKESEYGPSQITRLDPGQEGFLSVYVGRPEGPILEIFITMINEEKAAIIEKSLRIDISKEQ